MKKFSIVISIFLIFRIAPAQQTGSVIPLSPEIGPEIDAAERERYGLFPGMEGFPSAAILRLDDGNYRVRLVYQHEGRDKIISWEITRNEFMALVFAVQGTPVTAEPGPGPGGKEEPTVPGLEDTPGKKVDETTIMKTRDWTIEDALAYSETRRKREFLEHLGGTKYFKRWNFFKEQPLYAITKEEIHGVRHIKVHYIKNNIIEKIEFFNPDGAIEKWWKFTYDERGRKVRLEEFGADGEILFSHRYIYDENGKNIKEEIFNPDNQFIGMKRNHYDQLRRLIRQGTYGSDGKCLFWESYRYDKEGNLIRKETFAGDSGLLTGFETYTYDDRTSMKITQKFNRKGELIDRRVERWNP